jgi:hypothetical protein
MLVTTYFVWFAWPIVWTASENIRIVSVFNADEAHHLQIIRDAISQRTPRLEFGNYGHLYFNIALFPLFLMAYFNQVSDQHIMVVLRLVATIFAVATIAATFVLTRRYFGQFAAWLTAILLAIVPLKFLEFSVVSHPDVPQIFFLVVGVYFCCRFLEQEDFRWLIWSSAFAGLAFATKYGGIFLLPIIWMVLVAWIIKSDSSQTKIRAIQFARVARCVVAVVGIICAIVGFVITPEFVGRYFAADGRIDDVLQIRFLHSVRIATIFIGCSLLIVVILKRIWEAIARIPKLAACLSKITLSVATFCVVFLVTSPFSFYRLNFLKGMYFEARHTAFGHWFKASNNGLMWFHVLLSPQLIDFFIMGLAAVGLVLTAYTASRNGWRNPVLTPELVMWAWIAFYIGFLILRVNFRAEIYLLPVIPFLIIFSTRWVNHTVNYAAKKLPRKFLPILVSAILLIIGGVEVPKSLSRVCKWRQSVMNREQNSISVRAGKWLASNFSSANRILYDYYSYVPPSFLDAHNTWGGTIEILEDLKPNIVIVNKLISARFSDIRQATRYYEGKNEFMKKHEYYKALRDGRAGYMLIRDFRHIEVYGRSSD